MRTSSGTSSSSAPGWPSAASSSSGTAEPPARLAFGLTLEGEVACVPGRDAPPGGGRGRTVRIELTERVDWPASGASLVSDRRPATWIEAHPRAGHLLGAAGAGRVHVPPGAERVVVEPHGAWRRHLLARALPFVATQRGLEPLHAAGVTVGDRVIVLAGPSGAGKSTLAAVLMHAGAQPFADDVVAIEAGEDGSVVAHPGVARLRIRHDALERFPIALAEPIERDDEALEFAVPPAGGPLPMGALVLIGSRGRAVALERVRPVDPRLVLATSYDFLTQHPARLVNQLDVCARIATGVPCFRLDGAEPAAAARALLSELGAPA